MQHIYKGKFVDNTTFVDEFGNEYTLQTSNFGGDDSQGDGESDNTDSNNQDNKESNNNSQSNSDNNDTQSNDNNDNQNDDENDDSSQDNDDIIEPEVGALFDDVMTGKQYRWNGSGFEEV